MIAITKYADRLLSDLETVNYLPKIKKQQQDWIGRSEGAEIEFALNNIPGQIDGSHRVKVFTTRPDTIDGVTFIAVSPELAKKWLSIGWSASAEVQNYIAAAVAMQENDRLSEGRKKTGVDTGIKAINPVNGEAVPVFIADYVLGHYGTGAIMGVPQHDERDREFCEALGVAIIDRPLIPFDEAIEKAHGEKTVRYKLRDWVFSRQRYWGEPIPLVHCEKDGWVAIPEDQLPLTLPEVTAYELTDTGESPLSNITEWVNTTCPTCHGPAKRETDTMPNWAGSSWYFLRYCDPHNDQAFASEEALKQWMPIDLYNGGMEHTTLHLLYSRFWNKFLFDRGLVPTSEPYARRHSHGLILAEDGTKMSKSKGNVVNPDDIVKSHGADVLRVYEMFMGPFEEPVPWSTNGLIGVRRFLERVMKLPTLSAQQEPEEVTRAVHKLIKKFTSDIEAFGFNTAVAAMMTFVNEVYAAGAITQESLQLFVRVLCPFAPHIANELHEQLGGNGLVEAQPWPAFDSALAADKELSVAVQVNGKLRANLTVSPEATEAEVVAMARADERVAKYLTSEPKKIIYVPGRMVSFVV
jgi:leucyl-tRNA synthetase